MSSDKNRMDYWNMRWESNLVGFHKAEVHHMLIKHMDKLCPNGKPGNIFVPLCGKSLDMKWLADQGISVAGIDGAKTSLEQFYTEHGLEWEETSLPALGSDGKLLSSKDGILKLYCGDMMEFSSEVGGTFDAIWDRASIIALDREDLKRYVEVVKEILKPGGRILMELLQFDVAIMDDLPAGPTKPPPPFPMYEEDIKKLYEPECTIQFLDSDPRKLAGKDILSAVFLIVKK